MAEELQSLDFNQFTARDLNLPTDFVKHCKDSTIPIAVIGNGGSVSTLTKAQIEKLNNYRLFRCNWAFKDPSKLKKQYAFYVSQAYGSGKENKLKAELDDSISLNITSIYRFCIQILYNWNKLTSFCTPEGHPVWPTSGLQMFWHAAFHVPTPSIHLAGMDMYTHNRPKRHMSPVEIKEWMETHGKTYSSLEDKSVGTSFRKPNLCVVDTDNWISGIKKHLSTQHYIEIDILFALISFAHCKLNGTSVHIYNCPNLETIQKEAINNIDIIKRYYGARNNQLDDIQMKPICYSMWRLLNNTVDIVTGD